MVVEMVMVVMEEEVEEEEEREEREEEGMVDILHRTHKKKRLAYKRKCSVDLSNYHMN